MRRHATHWHRRIGLISLGLLGWLAVTGVLLNHAHSLGLDAPIGKPAIAKLYGLEADCEELGWALGPRTLIDCRTRAFLDNEALPDFRGAVRGAILWNDLFAIASEQGLLLTLESGERVEWLDAGMLPGKPLRLGSHNGFVVLQTPAGIFQSDAELTLWQSVPSETGIQWAHPTRIEPELREEAALAAAALELSWSKLIQDLHSGRVIGLAGTLLADLGALSILVLAFLGLVMAQRPARRRHPPAEVPADAAPGDKPTA